MSACPFVRHRSGSRLASYTASFKVLSIKSWGRLFYKTETEIWAYLGQSIDQYKIKVLVFIIQYAI